MSVDLQPELLRAFLAVVESRSFTSAASRLNRTQSAVSMQLKRLEHQIGHQLLDRTHNGVTLTPQGERLLPRAQELLELNDEILGELGIEDVAGRVRVGLPEDFTAHFLPQVLASFARAFPEVELDVTCALSVRLLEQLGAGELDVVLATQRVGGGGTLVRREDLVWVTSTQDDAHLRKPIPLALFPKACVFRTAALDAMEAAGHDVRAIYTSTSVSGIRAAVSAGLAVGVMVGGTIPEDLKVLGEDDGFPALPEVEIGLHTAQGGLRKPAHALADYIVQANEGVAKAA